MNKETRREYFPLGVCMCVNVANLNLIILNLHRNVCLKCI